MTVKAGIVKGYKTCKEIGEMFGVDPNTVNYQCRKGKIPGAVSIGRAWLIPDEAVSKIQFHYECIPYSLRKHDKKK